MSSTIQVSLNNEREIQLGQVMKARKDLRNCGSTDAVKMLLFEKMDEVAPLQIKESGTKEQA